MDPLRIILEEDLEDIEVLYRNSRTDIRKVKDKVTNKTLFLKKVQIYTNLSALRNERAMCGHLTLNHNNIIPLLQVIKGPDYYIYLSEYCPNGDLSEEIKSRMEAEPKKPWTEAQLLAIWSSLVSACEILESIKCAHRNLKPSHILKYSETLYKIGNLENIFDMLNRGDSGANYKIGAEIAVNQTISDRLDVFYISPEIRDMIGQNEGTQTYDPFLADVYSLGSVFLDMAALLVRKQIASYEEMDKENIIMIQNLNYSDKIKAILRSMLTFRKERRPRFMIIRINFFTEKLLEMTGKMSDKSMIMGSRAKSSNAIKTVDRLSGRNCSSRDKLINIEEGKKNIEEVKVQMHLLNKTNNIIKPFSSKLVQMEDEKEIVEDKEVELISPNKINPIAKVSDSEAVLQEFLLTLLGDKDLVKSIDQIELLELLPLPQTHNSTTKIYKSLLKSQNMLAIAKVYDISPEIIIKVEYEISLYSKFPKNNQCFPVFYGAFTSANKIYVLIEYVPRTLRDYITDRYTPVLSEGQIRLFLNSLLEGFKYLEEIQVAHCDIKPANILLTDNFLAKIIDFGSSRYITGNQNEEINIKGTRNYLAPELVAALDNGRKKMTYDMIKADAFSLGLTMLELVRRSEAAGLNLDFNRADLDKKVKKIPWEWAKRLIKKLVNEEPTERLTMDRAFKVFSASNPESFNTLVND